MIPTNVRTAIIDELERVIVENPRDQREANELRQCKNHRRQFPRDNTHERGRAEGGGGGATRTLEQQILDDVRTTMSVETAIVDTKQSTPQMKNDVDVQNKHRIRRAADMM